MKSHRTTPAQPTLAPRKRCAIYTRKSTDEGLDRQQPSSQRSGLGKVERCADVG